MTIRYRRKRNITLAIATAVTAIGLIASTAGFMARASNLPTPTAPERVERVVTDLSQYVLLHQTRNSSRMVVVAPDRAPCDESVTADSITKSNSI